MSIAIHHRPPSVNQLGMLYLSVSWGKNPWQLDLERSIRNTTAWLTAEDVETARVVGMCRIQSDLVFYCAIYDLVVHPDWQRRGIGSRLLEEAIRWADSHGPRLLHLWPNAGLASFYRRFGFEALGPDQPLMRLMRPARNQIAPRGQVHPVGSL